MTTINAGIDGVFLRRATPDDTVAIQEILSSEISAIDPTHGSFGIDIAKQIIESPGDPSPTWLFSELDGAEPFGFGNLHPDLTARVLNPVLSVRAEDPRFPVLFDWFLDEALRDFPDFDIHIEVHANHHDNLSHLADRGFEPIRYYHRLRATVTPNLQSPVMPDGVELRVVDLTNLNDLKDWYSVHQNSFAEHFGFVPRDFDSWVKRIRADTSIPPDGVYLLSTEGRAAGFIWLDDIDAAESRGFVVYLGVVEQERGHGFGRLLLEVALAHFSRRGYSHAELGVDTENSSGALGLYESMDFQVMSTTIEHSRAVRPLHEKSGSH
jgi:ribosomal protein S18 acetylase RimI-like enzyme